MFNSSDIFNSPSSFDQKKQDKNEKEKARRDMEKAMLEAIQKFLVIDDPDMLSTKLEKKDVLSKAFQCLQNFKVQVHLMKEQNRTLLVEIQNQKVMNLCERLNHQRRCGLLEQEIHRLREKYEGGGGREEDREIKCPSPEPSDLSSFQFSSPDSGVGSPPPAKKNCFFSSIDSPSSSSSSSSSSAFTPINRPIWKPWN